MNNTSFFLLQLSGPASVLILFLLIKRLFAPKNKWNDFLLGDNQRYSLSRLQATLWAFILISGQMSTIWICVALGHAEDYNLVFSEESIWLLGLSMGSYITSKGIESSRIANHEINDTALTPRMDWADFVCTNDKLDLSRFQMLIWTLISIVAYVVKTGFYLRSMVDYTDLDFSKHFFPLYSDADNILPTIDMSFIVLMGLSQGTYIGRKLVPSYKVDEFKREMNADYNIRLNAICVGLKFKEQEFEMLKGISGLNRDQQVLAEEELIKIRIQKNKLIEEMKTQGFAVNDCIE